MRWPRLKTLESDLQIALIEWRDYNKHLHPDLEMLISIPNEATYKSKRLQLMGIGRGFPDLFLFAESQPFPDWKGLALEAKRPLQVLRSEQVDWKKRLIQRGFNHVTFIALEEAIKAIKHHLGIRP